MRKSSMKVGDLVKGLPSEKYGITNENMTKAVVTAADGEWIGIKILEHTKGHTGRFNVEQKYFEVIGEVKPFDREAVIELQKNGCKKEILEYDLSDADLSYADLSGADLSGADLRRADLSGANLSGANLDFSCYPLWCGGLHVKTDKRLACQLAYHLCSMQCEDEEYIKMRNSILEFANQFHRVGECGTLEVIDEKEDKPCT